MTEPDLDLLKRYAVFHVEDAFAEIVRRHVDLVYSAALRQLRSPQLAEEVVQATFLNLARHAHRLLPGTVLAAWLYQVARRESVDVIRREARRQIRERVAFEMNTLHDPEAGWQRVEPLLDEAMEILDEPDRAALVLRFFENKSLREVGQALGASENAAQKRVTRAMERLRQFLTRRGVTISAAGLTAIVAANAVQAAPAGLAGTIVGTLPLAGASGVVPAAAAGAPGSKAFVMTILQKSLITAAVVATIGAGLYHARRTHSPAGVSAGPESNSVQAPDRATGTSLAEIAAASSSREAWTVTRAIDRQPGPPRSGPGVAQRLNSIVQPAPTPAQPASQEPAELARDTWRDVGFARPRDTLRTRGWTVLNGSRERFRDSVLLTAGARKGIEDAIVQMAERSNAPNKAELVKQVLESGYGAEEAILLPLMAEDKKVKYTAYRILSESPLTGDQATMEVETLLGSGGSKKETLKFQRVGPDWKILIDEDTLKTAQ